MGEDARESRLCNSSMHFGLSSEKLAKFGLQRHENRAGVVAGVYYASRDFFARWEDFPAFA